ncbi:hypothetical protein WKK05_38450 (plasmid) [Nostoc sp. UHCC 0302]|uniref:hypothetical protein n=1 Tax=Nostoc sp. UHCC 0302 TaxID=3134896 RepID=UPI00311CC215
MRPVLYSLITTLICTCLTAGCQQKVNNLSSVLLGSSAPQNVLSRITEYSAANDSSSYRGDGRGFR